MSFRGRVLIIDDEPAILAALKRALRREPDIEVRTATDPREGIEDFARFRPDLVLTDLAMPGLSGLDVLRRVKEVDPTVEVIVMTAYGTVDSAVEALRSGAFDFLSKPFESIDRVVDLVGSALSRRHLQVRLDEIVCAKDEDFGRGGIVGQSAGIREIIDIIRDISGSTISVLVRGESGTGKELVARALHQTSPRRHHPLVAVNCSALVETLLESELFGHVRGSFTGATANKRGLFEEAHEGSIFLDEIGELSPQMQAKLLRVLQSGEFKRIGDNATKRVDVRVIAATNRDLEQMIATGGFREDLYYRLNVISLEMPPLRDRRDDIPLLVDFFLKRFAERQRKSFEGLEPAFVDALLAHDWPGNVRELENVIERAVVLERSRKLSLSALPVMLREGYRKGRPVPQTGYHESVGPQSGDSPGLVPAGLPSGYHDAREAVLSAFHESYFERLLAQTAGNVSEAARISGIERSNLKRMIKRAGKEPESYRA